jgi:hypothetical protein
MGLDTKTYWLTDRQPQCNFDFDFVVQSSYELRVAVAEEAREQAVSSRSTEEYTKSACEYLACDLKTLRVL